MDPTKGLFRRRPSTASTRSRLRAQSSTSSVTAASTASTGNSIQAQSCPTSPKHSPLPRRSINEQRIPEDEETPQSPTTTKTVDNDATGTNSEAAEYAAAIEDARRETHQRQMQYHQQKSPTRSGSRNTQRVSSAGSRLMADRKNESRTESVNKSNVSTSNSATANNSSITTNTTTHLQRSASTVSGLAVRPRSSPGGLHSYTSGSVPSSVHGSRVDLRDMDKGSAIYLGCSAPRASTLSLSSSRGSSCGSAPPSPSHTPAVSPKHGIKRSSSIVKKPR